MRVLRVIGGLDPAFGGPSVSSVNSCIAAHRAGVETTCIYPFDARSRAYALEARRRMAAEGIQVQMFPLSRLPGSRARRWGVSVALAKRLLSMARGFDVIHAHGAWLFSSLVALLASRRATAAAALTPHETLSDFDLDQSRTFGARQIKRLARAGYYRACDLVVMSSPLEWEDSDPPAGRNPCRVVFHPVYDDAAGLPPEPSLPRDHGLHIGYLGRFDPKKNIDVLIRALAPLPGDVTLSIAGDGDPRLGDALHELAARHALQGRIRWLGFVSGREKEAFFDSIDLLAMPSAYECFGMAAAEAMIHGLPVVVSNRTGVAGVIASYGCGKVVLASAAAVGAAIADVYDRRESLPNLSRRARLAATEQFSFSAHGSRLLGAYEQLLQARDGGRA